MSPPYSPVSSFDPLLRGTTRSYAARIFFALCISIAYPAAASSQTDEDGEPSRFFETKIRPVLVEHCYECHSNESGKIEAGLALDSKAGWELGGDSGTAILPNNSNDSLLLKALRYQEIEMPPKGKLPDSVVADFEKWIQDGAFDPREGKGRSTSRVDFEKAKSHWAFLPIQISRLDEASYTTWSDGPIDVFVEDRHRKTGVSAAKPLEPLQWLRKVTLDLTGLPPTPDEIAEFLATPLEQATIATVDRLLASPQYGVRWARHWLDLVRYADTNGADENHDMPNAWRYRDWVVDALNQDMPLDQFICEQIAGDLMSPSVDEQVLASRLTATGMLVLGPKMLAEQDKPKMKIDIVDEQLDTISKTFLGVTLACARCHDHKFDPFTQRDYFALAGILMSTKTMANEDFVSQWLERPLPSQRIERLQNDYQPTIDQAQLRVTALLQKAHEEYLAANPGKELPADPEKHYPKESKDAIEAARAELKRIEQERPAHVSVMSVQESSIVDLPIHIRGNHLKPSPGKVARMVPAVLNEVCALEPIPEGESGRLQFARWLLSEKQPLLSRVMVNRVWMWHTGQPIVSTPANFGYAGEPPSHPQLLDFLSNSLREKGWSLKSLHREIVLSKTYAMSSISREFEGVDPDNQSIWRSPRKRLDVEAIRDSLLASTGGLDLRLKGPPNPIQSPRRTIYSKINRAALDDVLATFDYVEPANHIEQRPTTTVPFQGLFFMNHPMLFQGGERVIRSSPSHGSDSIATVQNLYLRFFGRPAKAAEVSRCLQFLDAAASDMDSSSSEATLTSNDASPPGEGRAKPSTWSERERQAWQALVRALLASAEFSWVP